MWLASIMANKQGAELSVSKGSVRSAVAGSVEVDASRPLRNLPVAVPFGIVYVPPVGAEAVVATAESGEVCLGIIGEGSPSLKAGEIKIYSSGNSSVTLTKDGKVLIEGDVYINGKEVAL